MATTFNGTKNLLSDGQIPAGYTRPTVATISTPVEFTYVKVISILKATVENASQATTMANIFNNATIGIDKQIEDHINLDFDDGVQTITAYAELTHLSTNIADLGGAGVWLQTTAVSYVATITVYVNVV